MPISPSECLNPSGDPDSFHLFCELLDSKLRDEFKGTPLQLIRMDYPGIPSFNFKRKVIDSYNSEQWNVLFVENDNGIDSYFDISPMLKTKINNETIIR